MQAEKQKFKQKTLKREVPKASEAKKERNTQMILLILLWQGS